MKISCIYKISSISKNRFYIGSAVDFKGRSRVHKHDLIKNIHHSQKLQRHFNKYGINDLFFTIIEIVEDKNNLIEREQFYIDTLNPYFNICKIAGNSLGVKRSKKFCDNLSKLHKNNKYWVGKKHTQESKNKLSEIHKKMTGELSVNYGKKFSEEWKNNMSKAKLGKKCSEETKLKMRKPKKGKKIVQLDLNNNIVNTWNKVTEASIALNIKQTSISNCLNKLSNTCAGYKWDYVK